MSASSIPVRLRPGSGAVPLLRTRYQFCAFGSGFAPRTKAPGIGTELESNQHASTTVRALRLSLPKVVTGLTCVVPELVHPDHCVSPVNLFLSSANPMSPPVSAAESASFQARTWLDDAFKRVVELRNTVAPMIDTIKIVASTQSSTLPVSLVFLLVCMVFSWFARVSPKGSGSGLESGAADFLGMPSSKRLFRVDQLR